MKKDTWVRTLLIVLPILALLLGGVVGYTLGSSRASSTEAGSSPSAAATASESPDATDAAEATPQATASSDGLSFAHPEERTVGDVTVGQATVTQGPADAAVHMIIVSDMQCPHCREAHEIIEPLSKEWLATGKIKIESITVSLLSPNANNWTMRAANLLGVVADVDPASWPAVQTALFEAQTQASAETIDDAALGKIATDAGANIPADRLAGLGNLEYQEWIQAISTSMTNQGVTGVPMVILDGQQIGNWTDADALNKTVTDAIEGRTAEPTATATSTPTPTAS